MAHGIAATHACDLLLRPLLLSFMPPVLLMRLPLRTRLDILHRILPWSHLFQVLGVHLVHAFDLGCDWRVLNARSHSLRVVMCMSFHSMGIVRLGARAIKLVPYFQWPLKTWYL